MTLSDLREMLSELTVPAVLAFFILCAIFGGEDGCRCSVNVTSKEAR